VRDFSVQLQQYQLCFDDTAAAVLYKRTDHKGSACFDFMRDMDSGTNSGQMIRLLRKSEIRQRKVHIESNFPTLAHMNSSTIAENESNANAGRAGPGLSAKVKLRTKQAGGRAAVVYVGVRLNSETKMYMC
jgi:hypothetical protein